MPFRALIDACWKEKYTAARFTRDLIAGITVGIIAIPLAMALAIGSGVAPQYGLYTAAVAGIVIALTGGSRFSVSGPTAAFVVILYPVSQQFGLAGLLVATLLSGIFLILMGLARFGRLIEYIPLSVTLGFTSGIGITIGTMQIKDFLGLQMAHVPEHYLQKVGALAMALPTINPGDAAIGVVTLGTLIIWPRLGIRLPGHLPALLAHPGTQGGLAFGDHRGGRDRGRSADAAAPAAGVRAGRRRDCGGVPARLHRLQHLPRHQLRRRRPGQAQVADDQVERGNAEALLGFLHRAGFADLVLVTFKQATQGRADNGFVFDDQNVRH